MKKILFFVSALAGLFFAASCQQEEFAPVEESNVVTFEVGIPEVATKAALGDDVSNINDLVYAVYRTAATTEDAAKADQGLQLIYQKNYDVNPFQGGKATIPIELINDQNYLIVFWAQVNDAWVKGEFDPVNNGNITYPEDMSANDSGLAAFTNVAFLSATEIKGGAIKRGVELQRPFAQINIGTTLPKNVTETVELYKSSVTVTGAGASYNPITKEIVASTAPVEFELAEVPGGKLPVNSTDYEYVAMNYIFANGSVGVAFNIETKKHGTVVTEAIPEVPVQTNYRTNIVGNLLTSEAEYSVTLDNTWGEPAKVYEIWDGTTVAKPEEEIDETTGETTYVVEAASELAYLAALVNGTLPSTFAITKASEPEAFNIKLTADIDLNNEQWTPIGTKEGGCFTGTFDGDGHKIMNLKYHSTEDDWYVGLFGRTKDATIKNLTIENADINCVKGLHFAALVGDAAGTTVIDNVNIKGNVKIAGDVTNDEVGRIGAVIGGNSGNFTLTNVKVEANEGSYVKGNSSIGGVAGQLQGKVRFENVTSNIEVVGYKFFAGGIIGLTATETTFKNCSSSGNVSIIGGREGNANDLYRVGAIAGGWDDNVNTPLVLEGCSYTGTLTGKPVAGEPATSFDCEGFVGRGYSAVVGATVNVNGKKYIYKGNGKYSVDGIIKVANAYELLAVAGTIEDGDTILLTDNVTFTEDNRSFNSGTWYDGLYYIGDKSFTIDLGGKTIGQKDGAVNDYLLNFKNDGAKANTITLKNGTIDAGTAAYCALATSSSNAQKMTINLENIELINNNYNGAVVKFRGGNELNVNAGTVITGKNSYVGIEVVGNNTVVNVYDGAEIYQKGTSSYVGAIIGASYNATLNIYGGKGKSAKCGIIVMSTGATINVSGGEWTANGDGTVAGDNNAVLVSQNNRYETGWACKSVLNVTGGTFKGGYNCYGMGPGVEADDAQINIKGGNFNADPAQYVVAGYEKTENAGIYTVDKPAALKELEAALANGGNVTLTKDVTLLEPIKVENKVVVLDLNGKTITAPLFSAFEVKAGGELTVKNGKVVAYESTVRAIGGKAIIESGEYTSTGTALDTPATYRYSLDCREGGELIINGGTFKSNNGMINVGSTVTINGGKFENIVEKTMTRHFAYVSAPLTINDGEFYGKANSSAGGCFFCGAAAGGDIQVKGGKFTSLWTSGSVNRIFEVYFGGTITVEGGMFNTNGGIATFVTENTDEATKAAYPYVAK